MSDRSEVVVVGSANADLILLVDRLPGPGETVLASGSRRVAGGKGANQAVASARSGARTELLAAVGADPDGRLLREELTRAGVGLTGLREVPEPSGLAVVTVGEDGENSIVVASGANARLTGLDRSDRALLAAGRILLCQLEVPIEVVIEASALARRHGLLNLLNAAPARALPVELLATVDLLIVNEHEAAALAGDPAVVAEPDRALEALLDVVPGVIVTLGPDGARYGSRDGTRLSVPAPVVRAVDTTAAGDTFCGVVAAALAQGRPIEAAIGRSVVAAALCVQRAGAIPSIPTAAQIDAVGVSEPRAGGTGC